MKLKAIFFERKIPKAVVCLLAAALMFGVVYYPAAVSVAGTTRQLPIYCVQRDQKVMSISVDAAWGGDARLRHIRNGFAANRLMRISYHKNAPCYGSGSSITRRFCELRRR